MAKFTETMNQGRRMCNEYVECIDCPLFRLIDERGEVCPFASDYDSEAIERIVMDWAAAHPEPRYPTWAEWLRMLGVEKLSDIIPADIAEKLGIKPIGG